MLCAVMLIARKAPDAIEWRNRRIYQLVTDRFASLDETPCKDLTKYCGGTYQGIIAKLDYIKNLGFNAIWISPHVEQVDNSTSAYHGYWASDFFKSNKFFGTDEELQLMIEEAHKRDIWVMADVVYNHVGRCHQDFSKLDLSCQVTFPLLEHYHTGNCHDDWDCSLAGLPDLNQTNEYVSKTLIEWAEYLIDFYGFDGFRIDTVKWINHDWWKTLRPHTPWYNVGEVWDVTYERLAAYMKPDEVYAVLNYPLSCRMNDAIYNSGNSMGVFWEYFNQAQEAMDAVGSNPADMGVFLENHDNPRFLHFSGDKTAYRNALCISQTWIGVPITYYGAEQDMDGGNDPDCRRPLWHYGYNQQAPEYLFLQKINKMRAKFDFTNMDQKMLIAENNFLVFSRGKQFVVATTNSGSGSGQISRSVDTQFEANAKVCNIFDGQCTNVGGNGKLQITLNGGEPAIYVRERDL
ncbi:1 [Hexamita inflata]|uniref:alpha-amylase n=1 Tax=Hexamita inflata TaxID=28002 RepID=A0AA86PHB0_9EUKA|nr:1 [Hexamita inflata] [Hexamita inflata]